ncbi:SRPBCC family protein [Paenibacillus sp. IB182496]|uniref:SRPBCC family protein n=1 Tax=Paenibacillus sabuli TaxID=2772509 RepID=A0A927BQE8_9BACL|nr:SRPBCC family protein [Paenibacillus sabuli]MBD2844828.1 SRPBCC family protein [Paenibacillus sabuli]
MSIDFEKSLGAVTRTVSEEQQREGKPVRRVTLERTYATTANDLWDVVTNPERLKRFFAPVTGELKLGGRFQIEGNAAGTVTTCEPTQYFAATWEFAGDVSWIEVRIAPEGEARCRIALSHICPINAHWAQFGPGATGVGWDLSLLGLGAYLADTAFEPSEGQAMLMSEAGMAFIVGACQQWGQAAAAAGEPAEQAEAAAARTTAFYTGGAAGERQED